MATVFCLLTTTCSELPSVSWSASTGDVVVVRVKAIWVDVVGQLLLAQSQYKVQIDGITHEHQQEVFACILPCTSGACLNATGQPVPSVSDTTFDT
jgi:hypothetical protein